jgi:hypothetical protein
LDECAARLGLTDEEPALREINQILERMDAAARTFGGVMYETREQALNERAARALADIEIAARTVSGITFGSIEQAIQAKIDRMNIESLIKTGDDISRGDLRAMINDIQNGDYVKEIKYIYIPLINEILQDFDAKLRLAREYEEISQKKYGINIKGLISKVKDVLARGKDQIAWEELTHNGEYSLALVGSDRRSSEWDGNPPAQAYPSAPAPTHAPPPTPAPAHAPPPAPAQPRGKGDVKFCAKCGQKLPANFKFCNRCGAKFQ